MACTSTTLTAISTSCGSNIPSIKKMWIGKYESATWTPTYNGVDADQQPVIESVVAQGLESGADAWVAFDFKKNTGSFDTEMTVNDNGSHYYTNTISLVFAKQDSAKRLAIQALASGDCAAIVLDGNGQYWLFGYNAELTNSAMTATTGTAVSDANQYTVTMSETSSILPIPVSDGDISVSKLIVSTNEVRTPVIYENANGEIEMVCATSGATIKYKTIYNGTTSAEQSYSAALTKVANTTYIAYAEKTGMVNSNTAIYTAE